MNAPFIIAELPAELVAGSEPWPAAPLDAECLRSDAKCYDCGHESRDQETAAYPAHVGTFLDEAIDMREPVGSELTKVVIAALDARMDRRRGWKANDRANHEQRIRTLIANALRCHFHRKPPRVLFFSKADANAYKEKPQWMRGESLAKAVRQLALLGLVCHQRGTKMPPNSKTRSSASAFWASDDLIQLATAKGANASTSIKRVADGDLVRLFAPKLRPTFDFSNRSLVRNAKRVTSPH